MDKRVPRWLIVFCLLVFIAISIRFFFESQRDLRPQRSKRYGEITVERRLPSHKIPKPETKKIAIVIDDLGPNLKEVRSLLRLEIPLTLSVLPFQTYSKRIAEETSKTHEILLHLPMEPKGYPEINPGKGVLLKGMTPEELTMQVQKDIDSVPHIIGVNNHMGSIFTEDQEAMRTLMTILKRKDLIFLDSLTTSDSVAYETASRIGLKAFKRQVFLDEKVETFHIERQIELLIRIAKKRGQAIGIGHPYPETIEALRNAFIETEREDIEIVPLSKLNPD